MEHSTRLLQFHPHFFLYCFGFFSEPKKSVWDRAFEISEAERLQDLDKNSIGSLGVWGWGIAGSEDAGFSSWSSSKNLNPSITMVAPT